MGSSPIRVAITSYASVAQLVEQRTENPRVVGSIPTGGTSDSVALRGFSSFGRASPCQGEGGGFEPRNPLQNEKVSLADTFSLLWRHSQVVRQRSAKPSPPVRIRVAPPKKRWVLNRVPIFFFWRCPHGSGRAPHIFDVRNPVRIPRPKVGELAHQTQGVGIFAIGEYSGGAPCSVPAIEQVRIDINPLMRIFDIR